jgi:basic membrane protein A
MRKFTAASLALTLAATGALAGSAVFAQDDDVFKVGVVTDVGQLEDKSFNEFSNQGAVDAAAALGGEHSVIVTEEIADYGNNIQTFVDEGFDAIVTVGFLIGSDTLAKAGENPDITFIGIDQSEAADYEGDNYQGIFFREAQPGYLVGIIAANITETGTIGAVGGTNLPAVVAFRDGYINGAKSVNPDIEVLYQESNPDPVIGFNDPERGAEITGQMLDLGADVIFQIAGGTGVGVLEAACAGGAYGIGVDVDQSKSLPPQAAECIVTSAEKKLQTTIDSVVQSVADGSFQSGLVIYDLSNEPPAVGISPFQEQYADLLTDDLQAQLDAAVAGMLDGSIDPGAPTE